MKENFFIFSRAALILTENMRLTPLERSLSASLLKEFVSFATSRGVRFFLADGAVLGLVRHGDIVPWDDDIDIVFDGTRQAELMEHFDGTVSISL